MTPVALPGRAYEGGREARESVRLKTIGCTKFEPSPKAAESFGRRDEPRSVACVNRQEKGIILATNSGGAEGINHLTSVFERLDIRGQPDQRPIATFLITTLGILRQTVGQLFEPPAPREVRS